MITTPAISQKEQMMKAPSLPDSPSSVSVGAAESQLAAELADADNAPDAARQKRRKKVSAARAKLAPQAAARLRKHDPDGLQR
jgi:hypothetical protein